MTNTEKLKELISSSRFITCLSGAGFSTESGIPDFRSENGIYKTVSKYGYNPEVILSRTFFNHNPQVFFEYYKENFLYTEVKPNNAHKALAKLEERGFLRGIITQNVDSLHTKAGSKNVLELHGSIYRNYCMKCKKSYSVDYIKNSSGIPRCECGGIVKPDVVLYEEALSEQLLKEASKLVLNSDLLIVGGTSLMVYPAAGFVDLFGNGKLVIINKSETPYDSSATLVIHDSLGKVLTDAVGL